MASPAPSDLPPELLPDAPLAGWRRRLGYGASTAGFTALALLLLQLLLAQRLEQQQRLGKDSFGARATACGYSNHAHAHRLVTARIPTIGFPSRAHLCGHEGHGAGAGG